MITGKRKAMNRITIKPHHLLDILKLHGKGLDVFVPDPSYGHDFYKVANKIVNHEVEFVIFTVHGDDICKPCKYNKENSCTDQVTKTSNEWKEHHNKEIDSILFDILGLEYDRTYSFEQLLSLLNQKLNYEVFKKAWPRASKEELDFRFDYALLGLIKVSQSYSG
jgi:hypothetical protein